MKSQSLNRNSGQFVLPGERLGVIEEFIPDSGTYVNDGIIFSEIVGRAVLDLPNKRVSVHPSVHEPKIPRIGNTILGQVQNVHVQNAVTRIVKIDDKKLSGYFTGILHISDARLRYVESMFTICRLGDILRAKVISEKNKIYHLSTKEKNLGVVYAFCSRCGNMLELSHQGTHCPKCSSIERRKTTLDYGKGVL